MEWKEVIDKQKVFESVITPIVLESSRMQTRVYPEGNDVFRAIDLIEFDKVKVCIIGQDPYHTPGVANGLAFSVNKGEKVPPSLQNVFKELQDDLGLPMPKHGDLSSWAKQGVLLLNTVLTVEQSSPGSHAGKGWEDVTGNIIRELSRREDPVIFVLWGNKARESFVKYSAHHENRVNVCFFAAHPSPFSAKKFFGCKHFSKINERLVSMGKDPINWSIE